MLENVTMTKEDRYNQNFKNHMDKMRRVAESRQSMRIDMRPKVVMRTMTIELMVASLGVCFCLGMPFYFFKIKPLFIRKQGDADAQKRERYLY